jgi:subtilase family serine protease
LRPFLILSDFLEGVVMNHGHLILRASIVAALATTSALVFANSADTSGTPALAGTSGIEAPRVTQTVNISNRVTVPKSHLAFVDKASSSVPLANTFTMNHLQLVLRPSALRTATLEALIANQHNPKSPQFQKWLTPQQFGEQFGVTDSDIAAVTSWLASQGFTVNNVYPNKTQIDFSGTAAQVNQAFHTQEKVYAVGEEKHLANAGDISVPAALQSVVAGVMGLNDFHPAPLLKKSRVAKWDASKKGYVLQKASATSASANPISQAVTPAGGTARGLAPNDLATIYGIKTIRANGVTGKGINIAVVEDGDMVPADWTNFVSVFNLGQYGGTFSQINPAPPSGTSNCSDPQIAGPIFYFGESGETLLDAEWATAIAPGANITVASCSDYNTDYSVASSNFFGGVFIAADNLVNASSGRPDVISASYGYGEQNVDAASKAAIDAMWAQADAEGISVFVSTGDSGSNPSFNGSTINNQSAVDANAFATSAHDTGVGGTDFADVLDGTTSQYFAPTPSVVGGSALSYVPEIPWNESCGNGVAAKANGFSSAIPFCLEALKWDPNGYYVTSEAGSGGPSSMDAKPAWQRQVYNAAADQSRDLPDISLFAGSFGDATWVIVCTSYYPCAPGFSTPMVFSGGTSLASPMFAGIQALVDQGLQARGMPVDQGNAAPTLYALAANEYGTATGPAPASLATCNADNGATGTSSCVFHNVTRGSISSQCVELHGYVGGVLEELSTPNCYFYATPFNGQVKLGLTSTEATPTSYTATNKAFPAQPGWSFASGLGSVNATNLLMAWRAFVNAPAAVTTSN